MERDEIAIEPIQKSNYFSLYISQPIINQTLHLLDSRIHSSRDDQHHDYCSKVRLVWFTWKIVRNRLLNSFDFKSFKQSWRHKHDGVLFKTFQRQRRVFFSLCTVAVGFWEALTIRLFLDYAFLRNDHSYTSHMRTSLRMSSAYIDRYFHLTGFSCYTMSVCENYSIYWCLW